MTAVRDRVARPRAQIAQKRWEITQKRWELNARRFYSTRLRFRDLAFDVGANHGTHTGQMLNRGARVVALEPQATLAAELAQKFPTARVLAMAVSDEPGQAVLHDFGHDAWASLDPGWDEFLPPAATPRGCYLVSVTTLDELIDEYGEPALVKIDTEGFDNRVLRGLSRPIERILFEVHAARPNEAAEAMQRLEQLGRYEYRLSPEETWHFSQPERSQQILTELPYYGNVYARRTG